MTDCWLAEPGLRPTFTELAEKLAEELQEGEQDVSFLFSFYRYRWFKEERAGRFLEWKHNIITLSYFRSSIT